MCLLEKTWNVKMKFTDVFHKVDDFLIRLMHGNIKWYFCKNLRQTNNNQTDYKVHYSLKKEKVTHKCLIDVIFYLMNKWRIYGQS